MTSPSKEGMVNVAIFRLTDGEDVSDYHEMISFGVTEGSVDEDVDRIARQLKTTFHKILEGK